MRKGIDNKRRPALRAYPRDKKDKFPNSALFTGNRIIIIKITYFSLILTIHANNGAGNNLISSY